MCHATSVKRPVGSVPVRSIHPFVRRPVSTLDLRFRCMVPSFHQDLEKVQVIQRHR